MFRDPKIFLEYLIALEPDSVYNALMKKFDYDLDYKSLDFTDEETRKLYRIGKENRESFWFALILMIYVLIGDCK